MTATTAMIKAYEVNPRGGAQALGKAERKSTAVGVGDVRMRVRAASLNYRDLAILRNARSLGAPTIPLSDGAGVVTEVGRDVTTLAPGDRVVAAFFPTWHDGPLSDFHHSRALGGGQDGVLAEEVVLPAAAFVKLPDWLSFEEGATLPCAGLTAYHALFHDRPVHPGDIVLVQGTGGVSIFALQLARAAGARVILTSSSAAKGERARTIGADHVIDYRADDKWGESAHAWTGGRGVDVVIDVGGPGTFNQSLAALGYGGKLSLIGVLTGTDGPVSTYGVLRKLITVQGIYVGSVALFESFLRALNATRIRPVIDRVFGFDEAAAAYDYVAAGKHFGKVVIRVGG